VDIGASAKLELVYNFCYLDLHVGDMLSVDVPHSATSLPSSCSIAVDCKFTHCEHIRHWQDRLLRLGRHTECWQ